MPEIVEVRVVASVLKKQIIGKKIEKVKILYFGIIDKDVNDFISEIEKKTILNINTYGKWLMFDLGEKTMLSHLRMEGKYFYVPSENKITKHDHIIFSLDNGYDLRYNDVRKFGKMLTVDTNKIYECSHIKKLGIEPDDKRLTTDYLLNKFKNKKIPIKEALLDQSIINGLGNIYVNEVLFASKINPFKKASDITKDEASKIIKESSKIITRSYELGGTTIKSYTSSLGVIGHYQDELKVQSKEGMPCLICNTPIKRKKIGGRSTFYCEKCQKTNIS